MTKFPSLLLALACLTTASVHAQLLDRNLIVNGDAESGPGTSTTTIVPIPGWTVVGTNLPLARRYGSIGTVYTSATPGPINRGITSSSAGALLPPLCSKSSMSVPWGRRLMRV